MHKISVCRRNRLPRENSHREASAQLLGPRAHLPTRAPQEAEERRE